MVINFQLFLFLLCSQKSNSPSLETGLSKWKVLRNAALNIGAEGLKKIFLKVVSMLCCNFFFCHKRPELKFTHCKSQIIFVLTYSSKYQSLD